jgi:putative redox protein
MARSRAVRVCLQAGAAWINEGWLDRVGGSDRRMAMPKSYRIRLVANADGTVVAENEHGARVVMGTSGPHRFSPVELLLVALGGCAGMDFVNLMAKQRRPIAPLELEVTAERAPADAERLAWLRVAYRLEVDEQDATKVERARRTIPEKTCTVSRTLMHGCTVEHVIEPPRTVR